MADFNRLYERLVVRRSKKKRVNAAPSAAVQRNDSVREKEADAVRIEEHRMHTEQQERDARVSGAVKRLRLTRNLRGFARLSACSPHSLALQLADSSENDQRCFLEKYKRVKGLPSRLTRKQEGRVGVLTRCMRLEREAARLYLRHTEDFEPEASSTVEGKPRVMDELLFFSPPSAVTRSLIGYANRGNVVPPPPPTPTSSRPRTGTRDGDE